MTLIDSIDVVAEIKALKARLQKTEDELVAVKNELEVVKKDLEVQKNTTKELEYAISQAGLRGRLIAVRQMCEELRGHVS